MRSGPGTRASGTGRASSRPNPSVLRRLPGSTGRLAPIATSRGSRAGTRPPPPPPTTPPFPSYAGRPPRTRLTPRTVDATARAVRTRPAVLVAVSTPGPSTSQNPYTPRTAVAPRSWSGRRSRAAARHRRRRPDRGAHRRRRGRGRRLRPLSRDGGVGPQLTQSGSASGSAAAASGASQQAAAKATPSTVDISVTLGRGTGEGSGAVATADGDVLTNNHVVAGAQGPITVTLADGSAAQATHRRPSPSYDLAVIKIEGVSGLTPATLGESAEPAGGPAGGGDRLAAGPAPARSPTASSARSTARSRCRARTAPRSSTTGSRPTRRSTQATPAARS